jgi:hypothetical protein
LEGELACEHVEDVRVVKMDVRLGATLPDRVACPGHVQPVVLAQDAQLAIRRVSDRLALVNG